MQNESDIHALIYQNPATREWWFIATDPEWRKWRGPFASIEAMERAEIAALGELPQNTRTKVNGPIKLNKETRQ